MPQAARRLLLVMCAKAVRTYDAAPTDAPVTTAATPFKLFPTVTIEAHTP